jgi:glycosyltransferase involved in cell wall biosynthesis
MVAPSPVLIISDAPSSPTGLGRICRELALRAYQNLSDVCRIATFGYGGGGSRDLPFMQYTIEGMSDWVLPTLPEIWHNWAGNEAGAILTIWDASRMGWFSRPNVMCEEPALKLFHTTAKIERWIYCPIDAEGPRGRLTYPLAQSLLGFDRILAYSPWGERVIRESLGKEFSQERDLNSIPHGIDSQTFYPRDRKASRKGFLSVTGATLVRGNPTAIQDDEPLIGAVATNQARKDWGLWAESCALFFERHPKARFWIHSDMMERYWSIPALLIDFGLIDRTLISLGHLTNDQMAQAYSACDLTLGIGAGEGFGYPLAESMFCGTPVIHGNYAGGIDFLPPELLINPIALHLEGSYACKRPVFDPKDWADRMEQFWGQRVEQPNELDWNNVWPRFEAWFREGLKK